MVRMFVIMVLVMAMAMAIRMVIVAMVMVVIVVMIIMITMIIIIMTRARSLHDAHNDKPYFIINMILFIGNISLAKKSPTHRVNI